MQDLETGRSISRSIVFLSITATISFVVAVSIVFFLATHFDKSLAPAPSYRSHDISVENGWSKQVVRGIGWKYVISNKIEREDVNYVKKFESLQEALVFNAVAEIEEWEYGFPVVAARRKIFSIDPATRWDDGVRTRILGINILIPREWSVAGVLCDVLAIAFSLLLFFYLVRMAICAMRIRRGRCGACGYVILGLPNDAACPECGTPCQYRLFAYCFREH